MRAYRFCTDDIGLLVNALNVRGAVLSGRTVLTDYVLEREDNWAPEAGRFVIPVTVDDLAANGLLEEAHPQVCWERSVETLTARKEEIAGLAVAPDERIEAYLLYVEAEIVSHGGFVSRNGFCDRVAALSRAAIRFRSRLKRSTLDGEGGG